MTDDLTLPCFPPSASVLAANSVVRSLFGMAFPLFTPAMYQKLGVHWSPALCCLLALICLPFPWIFEKHGKAIRMKCRFSKEAAEVLEMMLKGANAKYHDEGEFLNVDWKRFKNVFDAILTFRILLCSFSTENPTEVAANMELGMVRTTSNLSRMNSIRPQQSKVLQEQKRLSHHEEENSQNGHGKNTAQSSDHSSDLAH